MFQRPSFVVLGLLLLATVACPLSLPLAPLLGYPALFVIAVRLTLEWLEGRLERPAQAASTWVVYLGLVMILHGVLIGFDTALAGAPPDAGQKRFGAGLAYVGATAAGVAAVAAYLLEPGRRAVRKSVVEPDPLDGVPP